jgi:hypothetical protein
MDDFEVVMTFSAGLPADEKFVIESVDKEFAGIWNVGGDPQDAYLTFNANTIAVEITTLTQDRGTRPRASDDAPIERLVECLNGPLFCLDFVGVNNF